MGWGVPSGSLIEVVVVVGKGRLVWRGWMALAVARVARSGRRWVGCIVMVCIASWGFVVVERRDRFEESEDRKRKRAIGRRNRCAIN